MLSVSTLLVTLVAVVTNRGNPVAAMFPGYKRKYQKHEFLAKSLHNNLNYSIISPVSRGVKTLFQYTFINIVRKKCLSFRKSCDVDCDVTDILYLNIMCKSKKIDSKKLHKCKQTLFSFSGSIFSDSHCISTIF